MRVFYWAFVALLAAVLAIFAVSNRASVSVGFWPLPFAVDLPLYLLVLVPALVGFVLGRLAAWFAASRRRREMRQRRRRIAALERELAATQSLLDERPALSPPG